MSNSDNGEAAVPPARPRRNLIARIFRSHDFLRDIVVTTLGVLIALGIGEAVDEVRWRLRIAANERTMREELGLLRSVYIERQMLEPCIARRLTELREILYDARKTGRLPAIANVGAPPNHAKFGDSWNMMLGTEIPLHIPPRKLMGIATIWVNEDAFSSQVDRQREAFDQLNLIEDRAGPADDALLLELEKLLVEATNTSDATLFIAKQDDAGLGDFDVTPLWRPDEPLQRNLLQREIDSRYLCRPLEVDGKPYRLRGTVRTPRQPFVPTKA